MERLLRSNLTPILGGIALSGFGLTAYFAGYARGSRLLSDVGGGAAILGILVMVGGLMLQQYLENRATYGPRATNLEAGRQIRHSIRVVAAFLILRWLALEGFQLLPSPRDSESWVPTLVVLVPTGFVALLAPFLLAARGAEILRRLAAWLAG